MLWFGSLMTSSPAPRSRSRQRPASSSARSNRPSGRCGQRCLEPRERGGRREARVEALSAGLRLPGAGGDVVALGRRVRDEPGPEGLGVADVESAAAVRPAEPLLRADRVEVGRGGVDLDRAHRLGAVDQHRDPGRLPQLAPGHQLPVEPRDGRERDQARPRRDERAQRCRRSRRRAVRATGRCGDRRRRRGAGR